MNLTAQKITADALLKLRAGGARVDRENNIPHNKRFKNQVRKGKGDIVGYSAKGLHIECEVKTIGDKLSNEQIQRLSDIRGCGGLTFVATEYQGVTVIYPFTEYIQL